MNDFRKVSVCLTLLLFGAVALTAYGQGAKPAAQPAAALKLVPAEIRFESTSGTATVNVMLGEKAVKGKDLKSAAIESKGWMFSVAKSASDPASVTVSTLPEKVEDGSYRLVVKAAGQVAYADVFVTLTPKAARSTLTYLPPRLELDDNYVQGTVLTYKIEGPIDLDYIWQVNGVTVLQGPGETKLEHKLDAVGPCTIRVTLKQGDRTIGNSEGATKVTPVVPGRAYQ